MAASKQVERFLPGVDAFPASFWSTPTALCEIMGRQGSDKGHALVASCKHNYTQYYHHLFEHRRAEALKIFELGLGTNNPHLPSNMSVHGVPGASLRGWSEYFPNASIFGADIDRAILFQEPPRIRTFYCDQTQPLEVARMWHNNPELRRESFDLIVEDGLHDFSANVCFFTNSFYKVRPGGYYIIEDVAAPELVRWRQMLEEWRRVFSGFHFSLLTLPNRLNSYDNSLVVAWKIAPSTEDGEGS